MKIELANYLNSETEKLKSSQRAAMLAKDKNHPWGKDGFCTLCHNVHRTDFRENDLCPKLLK